MLIGCWLTLVPANERSNQKNDIDENDSCKQVDKSLEEKGRYVWLHPIFNNKKYHKYKKWDDD